VTEKPSTMAPPTVIPTKNPIVSATAHASRDKPASFAIVTGGPGTFRVFTSSGVDWVIEYTDPAGKTVKVNEKGSVGNEEILLNTTGEVAVLKVYPYSYTAEGDVLLSVDGAVKVEASSSGTSPTPSGIIPTGTTSTEPEHSFPIPVIGVVIGVFIIAAVLVIWKKW